MKERRGGEICKPARNAQNKLCQGKRGVVLLGLALCTHPFPTHAVEYRERGGKSKGVEEETAKQIITIVTNVKCLDPLSISHVSTSRPLPINLQTQQQTDAGVEYEHDPTVQVG